MRFAVKFSILHVIDVNPYVAVVIGMACAVQKLGYWQQNLLIAGQASDISFGLQYTDWHHKSI